MSRVSIVPAVAALAVTGFLVAPIPAQADDVPDALSVEWKGKRPCEKLFEDAQIRVLRCTFPPGECTCAILIRPTLPIFPQTGTES